MNYSLLFMPFLPLLAYFLVDYFKGFKAGIYAAIAAAIFMLVWDYSQTGMVDRFAAGESGLILLMGAISLRLNNEKLFKFQPTVVGLIAATIFFYFQIFDEPLMVRYIPQIDRLFANQTKIPPEMEQVLALMHTTAFQQKLAVTSLYIGLLLLAHALVMAWAALRCTTSQWFAWRLALYPGLLIVMAKGLGVF